MGFVKSAGRRARAAMKAVSTWSSDRRVQAAGLGITALGFTVYLGVLNGAQTQPSRVTSSLLVVLAAVFQALSANLFNKVGRADPSLARATVRRLLRMGVRAKASKEVAERAFDSANTTVLRKVIGILSTELSWLEEGLADAVEDWAEVHGDVIRNLIKELKEAEENNGEN